MGDKSVFVDSLDLHREMNQKQQMCHKRQISLRRLTDRFRRETSSKNEHKVTAPVLVY
jgi:hypothetical protein